MAAPAVGTSPVFKLLKNGATFTGLTHSSAPSGGIGTYYGLTTAWLPITGGTDYFTVRLDSGTGVTVSQLAWFSIEFRK